MIIPESLAEHLLVPFLVQVEGLRLGSRSRTPLPPRDNRAGQEGGHQSRSMGIDLGLSWPCRGFFASPMLVPLLPQVHLHPTPCGSAARSHQRDRSRQGSPTTPAATSGQGCAPQPVPATTKRKRPTGFGPAGRLRHTTDATDRKRGRALTISCAESVPRLFDDRRMRTPLSVRVQRGNPLQDRLSPLQARGSAPSGLIFSEH